MRPRPREMIADRIERLGALDPPAELLQKAVRRLVPQESGAKEALSGTWLGHPLHPVLTDVVIGAWTSAWLLDAFGGEEVEEAADQLIAVGIVAALPTALSGLSDWAELRGGARRVGSVHAAGNVTALLLHALSWLARQDGRRRYGRSLSMIGVGVATVSAWLGGHLSFGKATGVDQTVFEDPPTDWTPVTDDDKLNEGELIRRSARGAGVLLVRHEDRIFALIDRCSHRGCSLSEGSLVDGMVKCPCHGSTFRLDGSLVKGPAVGIS